MIKATEPNSLIVCGLKFIPTVKRRIAMPISENKVKVSGDKEEAIRGPTKRPVMICPIISGCRRRVITTDKAKATPIIILSSANSDI